MHSLASLNKPASSDNLFARYPLTFFFIIAYVGSWLVMMPYLRFNQDIGLLSFNWPVPFALSAALAPFTGPFLAALIMIGAIEGKKGMRLLLSRFMRWQVGLGWYLFALVGIPVIMLFGAIVLPGVLASFQAPSSALLLSYPLSFIIMLVIGGPLGEETGWRGFALSRMQCAQGPLLGSFSLGILWAFWHLPYFWMPEWGTPKSCPLDIVYFMLAAIALNIIYTWVFNNTEGSLIIVILMHASNDAFFINQLFFAPVVTDTLLPLVIGFGTMALLLIICTRGRLGYDSLFHTNSKQYF